jgi:hypothetical protein
VRTKFAVSVLLLALGITVAATVTGQEEPLPTVHSRAFAIEPAMIVLAVEPIRITQQPTLADAVRRNDYVSFHALYEETKPAEYRTLHDLWTWAITDPVGAFYGREMYDRLSRAYPGYASYIETYKIVDQRGNVFYPTSETRTFLLQKALEKASPRVQIAEAPRSASVRSAAVRSASVRSAAVRSAGVPPAVPAASRRRRATSTVAKSTPVVAKTTPEIAKPAPVQTPAPAPVQATAPAPVQTPAPAPVQTTPPVVVTPDGGVDAAGPAGVDAGVPEKRTPNSGILLLVVGLIGVGLLAVILRTPREATPTSIIQPQAAPPAEPEVNAPVESIRRPGSGDSPKPRATGSHG